MAALLLDADAAALHAAARDDAPEFVRLPSHVPECSMSTIPAPAGSSHLQHKASLFLAMPPAAVFDILADLDKFVAVNPAVRFTMARRLDPQHEMLHMLLSLNFPVAMREFLLLRRCVFDPASASGYLVMTSVTDDTVPPTPGCLPGIMRRSGFIVMPAAGYPDASIVTAVMDVDLNSSALPAVLCEHFQSYGVLPTTLWRLRAVAAAREVIPRSYLYHTIGRVDHMVPSSITAVAANPTGYSLLAQKLHLRFLDSVGFCGLDGWKTVKNGGGVEVWDRTVQGSNPDAPPIDVDCCKGWFRLKQPPHVVANVLLSEQHRGLWHVRSRHSTVVRQVGPLARVIDEWTHPYSASRRKPVRLLQSVQDCAGTISISESSIAHGLGDAPPETAGTIVSSGVVLHPYLSGCIMVFVYETRLPEWEKQQTSANTENGSFATTVSSMPPDFSTPTSAASNDTAAAGGAGGPAGPARSNSEASDEAQGSDSEFSVSAVKSTDSPTASDSRDHSSALPAAATSVRPLKRPGVSAADLMAERFVESVRTLRDGLDMLERTDAPVTKLLPPGAQAAQMMAANAAMSTMPVAPGFPTMGAVGGGVGAGDMRAAPKVSKPSVSRTAGRVCARCGTTETPKWRRSADRTQHLCNACGLAVKKEMRDGGHASTAAARRQTRGREAGDALPPAKSRPTPEGAIARPSEAAAAAEVVDGES